MKLINQIRTAYVQDSAALATIEAEHSTPRKLANTAVSVIELILVAMLVDRFLFDYLKLSMYSIGLLAISNISLWLISAVFLKARTNGLKTWFRIAAPAALLAFIFAVGLYELQGAINNAAPEIKKERETVTEQRHRMLVDAYTFMDDHNNGLLQLHTIGDTDPPAHTLSMSITARVLDVGYKIAGTYNREVAPYDATNLHSLQLFLSGGRVVRLMSPTNRDDFVERYEAYQKGQIQIFEPGLYNLSCAFDPQNKLVRVNSAPWANRINLLDDDRFFTLTRICMAYADPNKLPPHIPMDPCSGTPDDTVFEVATYTRSCINKMLGRPAHESYPRFDDINGDAQ